MGAGQSSTRGASAASDNTPKKTDYYELLEVDQQAGDEEIKKAYRKRALELHPDRNYTDVERATQRFAEVQAAYEVLSDPQERAWYDSHRDAILRGDDPTDDTAAGGGGAPPQYHNVRLVTADEIYALIGRFNKTVPLDDSPGSFFTVLRETFDRIADGELAAAEWENLPSPPIEYPSFGQSGDGDKTVRQFYAAWQGFSTRLSFAWHDRWRLSDAPDRRVRRLMEKENRKLREDAAREFADAVRTLVVFVRKRDPRYASSTPQSEAERQKVLREAAAAQAARSRAAHQEKLRRKNDGAGDFVVPEWAQSREGEDEAHLGEFSETEEESEVEHIECVVCGKTFKSEKQYEAHEKSKKHIKAVQQLKRQMRKDNANFDLDNGVTQQEQQQQQKPGGFVDEDDGGVDDEQDLEHDDGPGTPFTEATGYTETTLKTDTATEPTSSKVTTAASDDEEDSEDDEYASRDDVEARLTGGPKREKKGGDALLRSDGDEAIGDLVGQVGDISLESESENQSPQKKVGKAKAKREKKAARQAASNASASHTCTQCNDAFDSRTKLFKHLDESGHAALNTAAPATKSGKKKKKR